MNFKSRYCLLGVFLCSSILLVLSVLRIWPIDVAASRFGRSNSTRHPYLDQTDLGFESADRRQRRAAENRRRVGLDGTAAVDTRNCRLSTCFNASLCRRNGFLVYVYPSANDVTESGSSKYGDILRVLRQARYYTEDPERACLFVLGVDTLDRDRLGAEFVSDAQTQIGALKWWNSGVNHIIFNLYSGTWPDYDENGLGFSTGRAMLVKASISRLNYRPGFDVSFPLFHREHSFRGGEPASLAGTMLPSARKYLLSFKGKRYLTGIGSETRNSLYHIHNGHDIILLTTCRHGKGWKKVEDERCEMDNQEYDKFDYKVLLHNSTFCLVPRGRRLGSYRFLESLQAGCIPVLLSNDWVLPFSEVIDWSKAVIWADERTLLQVPGMLRSISINEIQLMRQQCQFLWDTYFSSIDRIVSTTLEILKDRIEQYIARSSFIWNSPPGSLVVLPEFSQMPTEFPFFGHHTGMNFTAGSFTAVILVRNRTMAPSSSSPLSRLMTSLSRSIHLHKVIVLWHTDAPVSPDVRWPLKVPVISKVVQSVGERFTLFKEIETDAVLSLDEDTQMVTDEIDFAFNVWTNYPDRIVGYSARGHFWDDGRRRWGYSSKWSNDYSMVLTSGAFYHRYYGYLYSNWLPKSSLHVVNQLQNCEDILLNILVAHIVRHPPIKLTQHHNYSREFVTVHGSDMSAFLGSHLPSNTSKNHFAERHFCLSQFASAFGYMPLLRSEIRFDPLLYKDQVSIFRKKYRQIETVN